MNMWQTNQFCELAPSLLADVESVEWRQEERSLEVHWCWDCHISTLSHK